MKLYGIPNCSTVKKARAWLEKNKIPYEFHDYKKQGVDAAKLEKWVQKHGWEEILNKKGMTWRNLPENQKTNITLAKAIKIMIANPSIIKRPIVEKGQKRVIGFDETEYKKIA